MAEQKKSSRILEFVLIFALIYLASEVVMRYVFPEKKPGEDVSVVTMQPESSSFRIGHHPVLTLQNQSDKSVSIPDRCPEPPVDIYREVKAASGSTLEKLMAKKTDAPCVVLPDVEPGETVEISLAPWKYVLFAEPGNYEARLAATTATGGMVTARFSVHEPGVFVKTFRTFITKPFLNFLIFTASLLPDHNLGIAIIILTLLVKLLLYFPTQHSMEGQRRMQLLQPKLEEIRKRHKENPTKMNEETMRHWKEAGVSPFSSCLPIILQFPILIGLFFVIRDGSNLALSREFIYPFYQHLSWNFHTMFLGLDLTQPHWIFAPILVLLQFFQMWLAMKTGKKPGQEQDKTAKMQQWVMMGTLPLMIGYFAFQFPGAVSLYWGVSTVFAIGQQIVANRKVVS